MLKNQWNKLQAVCSRIKAKCRRKPSKLQLMLNTCWPPAVLQAELLPEAVISPILVVSYRLLWLPHQPLRVWQQTKGVGPAIRDTNCSLLDPQLPGAWTALQEANRNHNRLER